MAGKFNLNQLLTDVSKRAASGESAPPVAARRTAGKIVMLSVYDLVPSEDNFYSMNDIEELKGKIELAGKVLQNLIVIPMDSGKYKVIAGHRRRLASIALVEEGKPEYEFVPCTVEANEADAEVQAIREEIMLIAANSQREKTAWDKIEETRRTRDLLEKIKKREKIPGDMRKHVAKALNTSPAQIGRYDAIINNLCPEFMEELKQDRINISTAYELSGLSKEVQQAAFEEFRESGTISIKDAKAKKPEPAPERAEPEQPQAEEPPRAVQPQEASQPAPEKPAEPEPTPEPEQPPEKTGESETEAPPDAAEEPEQPTAAPELSPPAPPDIAENTETLKMYRIDNGFIGDGNVRAYCVARTEAQARELAEAEFQKDARGESRTYPAEYWKNLTLTILCDDVSQGFCGEVSD